MAKASLAKVFISVLVLCALAASGYWFLQRTGTDECAFCHRPIHAASRAFAEVKGKRVATCCVRCAMTQDIQQHGFVRLLEVTDYNTGNALAPKDAYYVEGSRVVLCELHQPHVDDTMRPEHQVFDRCEPSLYAFAQRESAAAFAAQNGGSVVRFEDLLRELPPQPTATPAPAETGKKP